MFPKMAFTETVERVEALCHTRVVKVRFPLFALLLLSYAGTWADGIRGDTERAERLQGKGQGTPGCLVPLAEPAAGNNDSTACWRIICTGESH